MRYLERLAASGDLAIDDPDDAFRLLYGLVVQDSQIARSSASDAHTVRHPQARRRGRRPLPRANRRAEGPEA
jgi:hypothetical protein